MKAGGKQADNAPVARNAYIRTIIEGKEKGQDRSNGVKRKVKD